MTIIREPELLGRRSRPQPIPRIRFDAHRPRPEPRVDVHVPRRNIRIDTMFWQHRSPFVGTQEQLDDLRRAANQRAADRAVADFANFMASHQATKQQSILDAHRPVFKRLTPVIHVGFLPMLWIITTCHCGGRWPCNDIKLFLRHKFGWTKDLTEPLKQLADELPQPETRWTRLKRRFTQGRKTRANGDVGGESAATVTARHGARS